MRERAKGQALSEFALVFPITILTIFAVIVFGLYIFYQQQVTNVAREAAGFPRFTVRLPPVQRHHGATHKHIQPRIPSTRSTVMVPIIQTTCTRGRR